ncbi:MAG: N-terminal domain intergin-like repeat and c-terminal-cell wall-associated hydrolase domain [Myxococcaceae bacterium]|nr:N-terminal domain intergin-like repeat and c-terminal-cell wall-associated hydrolase domain [Myxococcaceae bacterium]
MNDRLQANQALEVGKALLSPNGQTMFDFQGDGNLVLTVMRAGARVARWSSRTNGKNASRCILQGDGNLVIYGKDDKALWASNTAVHVGGDLARLVVQDDENVVLTRQNQTAWSTNTWMSAPIHVGFDASRYGFRFANTFDSVPYKVGTVTLHSSGACGGMSYASLDYFHANRAAPATPAQPPTNEALAEYIFRRQQDSLLGSWHGSKFVALIMNPDDHALWYWSTHDEWTALQHALASGPIPLGLIKRYLDFADAHQVIATGCQTGSRERRIFIHDPNHPEREHELLQLAGNLHWLHTAGGGEADWRGLFVETGYTAVAPP